MKYDKIQIAGSIVALLAIIILGIFLIQIPFPAFEYAIADDHLVEITQPLGEEMSEFMWGFRSIDLLGQAFVLFSTAAGSLAVLIGIEHMEEGETE
ncbi:MAG: hypothetical protein GF309_11945 [Candidatus Lokiarchaeota archaeon]|jgi:hypothetical protein|nr:hypothetical protein [Candidatus Lokiarchaeota archaeon]